ncbi:unnamed protein product, partial [Staurois parvus]
GIQRHQQKVTRPLFTGGNCVTCFAHGKERQLIQPELHQILHQGRTDNSWGPRAIGDHGAPVSLPKLKKAYEKGTRGISWAPY